MMKLFFLFFNIWLLTITSYAQKGIKIALHHRVILNLEDCIVHAEILSTENKVIPSSHLYYYWYRANDIKKTRGDYDGKLLHGGYSSFYLNKNLKEKGEFKYGVKTKSWKTWYLNGELQEITHWKKGKQEGKFESYNEQGIKIKEGFYKNDQYQGKIKIYHPNDSVEIKVYEKGKHIKTESTVNKKKEKTLKQDSSFKIKKFFRINSLQQDKVKET